MLPQDLKQQELFPLSSLPMRCQVCEVSPCGLPRSCELKAHRSKLSGRKLIRIIKMSIPTPTAQPGASLNMKGTLNGLFTSEEDSNLKVTQYCIGRARNMDRNFILELIGPC